MVTGKTRLLSICPSRSRPEKLAYMLKTFDETKSEGTEMVVYVADDDPRLKEYIPVLDGRDYRIGPRKTIVEVNNYFTTEVYPGLPYYQEVNDDHAYRTKGWDEKLIHVIEFHGLGWGIACGEDTVHKHWQNIKHPSAALISGNIVRALGYFFWPKLKHLGCDGFIRDIGEGIDKLFYVPDVRIEHLHFVNKKADFDKDPNYSSIYTKEATEYMEGVILEWQRDFKWRDINRIKDAMEKEWKKRMKRPYQS